MSDTQVQAIKTAAAQKNNTNGKNGKHPLGADSIYFKVAVPTSIIKRDGRIVPFDDQLIHKALERCFASLGQEPKTSIDDITHQVVNVVAAKFDLPTVEGVQDIVEMVLQAAGEYEAAKHYILYRAEHAKIRAKRPVPTEVRDAFAESDQYFPTQLQKFQFYDKYSRFNYELGRRETWLETVNRAVDYLRELSDYRLPTAVYDRIRQGILEMKVMPSMRLLAMAGPAARRNNITIYNCSYMPVDSIDSFVEALIISMSGCGVGFSVERQYVEQFPRITRQSGKPAPMHVVKDTSEGWADALRTGLTAWFGGDDVKFDYSEVRPAGMPLRVKGGRASGPEPLRQMLDFARGRILARQGSFLRPLDAHDMMCAVGNAAVSGGVRRTAMISLFDYDDLEMRHCKDGDFWRNNSQRWNANNSAVWPNRELTQAEITRFVLDMVESGRGEPGIFNRRAAIGNRPTRRKEAEFGTNPSLRKGTLVYTTDGIVPIEDLEGKDFFVRNLQGESSPAKCFLSGKDKPLYKISLKGGHTYYATQEHKWPVMQRDGTVIKMTTDQLKAGFYFPILRVNSLEYGSEGGYDDGFLAGWLLGDGWLIQRSDNGKTQYGLILSQEDYESPIRTRLERSLRRLGSNATFTHRERDASVWYELNTQSEQLDCWAENFGIRPKSEGLPGSVWTSASEEFRKGVIDALISADGSIDVNKQPGYPVIVLVSAHEKLIEDVSALLGFYGIKTSVRQSQSVSRFPNAKDYERTYTRYDLTISGMSDLEHFKSIIRLSHPEKQAKLYSGKPRQNQPQFGTEGIRVISVEETGLQEDVWDISVFDQSHCFQLAHCITGNCGEIILRPYQFCNLTSAIARADDTYETLREKVELATIIGTIQSMATFFPGLRPEWQKNCEEERLLGVDLNGQMDSPAVQDPEIQSGLRDVAVETNRLYAEMLGIPQSVSVTCVKPSGNSSQLVDSSSGLHARWAPYYVRNVRVGSHSPVFKVLNDAGVPMDPENGQTRDNAITWVVHFPVKSPATAVTRNDRTALAQCHFWLQNKVYYTEHNPSVTITYHESEVLDIIRWVWENQDKIGGMAFLPAFDAQYDQMPYVEIGEEEYEQLAAKFPEIDFSKIYRYEEEDLTTAAQELACMAGGCDV